MDAEKKTAPSGRMADINVTPLIDVFLVLLIIFMVVTPLAQRSLDASLPQPAPGPTAGPPPPVLVLEIDATGFALNQMPIASVNDLEDRLRSALETRSDKTLFVRPSGGVAYDRVMEALDVARGAGAGRIGLLDDTPPSR